MRAMLALVLLALAGCVDDGEDRESQAAPGDPDLLLAQVVDVTARPAGDCFEPGTTDAAPAEFDVPEAARYVRIEGTFAAGRVALSVAREDGGRVGFAAGTSPVVVELEEGALVDAAKLRVLAHACEGTGETVVRVMATFRRAPPAGLQGP